MRVGTAMATAGRGWARTLVQAATDSADPDWALARAAVRRICRLVAVDYACFSFEPPDLCRVALRGAVVPEPYPPPVAMPRPLAVAAPRVHNCVPNIEDPVARLLRNHQTYDAQYLLGWRDADVDSKDPRFPERHCFVGTKLMITPATRRRICISASSTSSRGWRRSSTTLLRGASSMRA